MESYWKIIDSKVRINFIFADFTEDDTSWYDSTWMGNVRKSSIAPSLTSKVELSPPPAARARSTLYGNGQGTAAGGWDEEEQSYIVHMRGLPFKATEQDIMNVSLFYVLFKQGIHLRQRQAEARCGSLSLASVDGATNRATCLRGCSDPSRQWSVYQSEASPRNSPPHVQYGWNMPPLVENKKHSLVQGATHLGSPLPVVYSQLYDELFSFLNFS